ncbi:hypothetical protein [Aureivirga sp. CE67]|uniref:hypothetical protein n=1 Tax=Aureivirga sp. CE67 TaxID=1788983 RepID=UPI0018CA01DA|nr:hypothetical protein [Aureivirga sp. CE67]
MKKLFTLFLISILFSSCGVTIDSVVDHSLFKKPYENSLIVIPYEKYSTKNFSRELQDNLKYEFKENNMKVDFILFEAKDESLSLNQDDYIEKQINRAIVEGEKDILFIFKPTNLDYVNGGLQSATYKLVGIDVKTKKEVWKAKFSSSSSFGPAMFAEKSAKTIFAKLKEDGVL